MKDRPNDAGRDGAYQARVVILDITVEAWPPGNWEALAERCAAAAAGVAPELAHHRLEASIVFADDAQIHALNLQWRNRDRPTNVLSFPMLDRESLVALPAEGPPELLGDIALACETCTREAADKEVPVERHAAHLLVHGFLHLAGLDHETSAADADYMELLEVKALALLGIDDPYDDGPRSLPEMTGDDQAYGR